MQRSTSRALASAAVVAGLGGLAAIALGSQPGRRRATAATTLTPRIVVRTQTDVHTITRVKRDLPPLQAPQTVRPAAPAPHVAVTPVSAPAAVRRVVPVVRPVPAPAPVRSRASGGAGARHGDDGSDGAGRTEREGDGQDD